MRLPCNQLFLKGLFPKMSDTLPSPHTVLLWFKDTFGSPPFPGDWLSVTLPQQPYIAPDEIEINYILEHLGLIPFLSWRYPKNQNPVLVLLLLLSLNVQSAIHRAYSSASDLVTCVFQGAAMGRRNTNLYYLALVCVNLDIHLLSFFHL